MDGFSWVYPATRAGLAGVNNHHEPLMVGFHGHRFLGADDSILHMIAVTF